MIGWLAVGAWAGPWVPEPGHFYAKLESSVFAGSAGSAPESAAMAPEDLTYRDARLSGYAEVGLPWDSHVTAFVPLVAAWNSSDTARYLTVAAGDAELGITRALPVSVPVAAEVRARFPLYGDRTAQRVASYGHLGHGFPDPGDGAVSLDGWLHAGSGWRVDEVRGWVQAAAGYRLRFGQRVDGLVFDAAGGWSPDAGWLGLGVGGTQSFGDDGITRSGVALRLFGALKVTELLAVEAYGSWMPMAHMMAPGISAGCGFSVKR